MECDFIFLCDYAERDRKLHAVGIGWDTINAATLPHKHPVMCLVARLSGSIAENGTKDIALHLLDADGADVITPLAQKVLFEVKQPRLAGNLLIVMQLGNVEFQSYGTYALHLLLQGNQIGSVSFNIVEPPTTS